MSFCRRPDGWEREQVWEGPWRREGAGAGGPPGRQWGLSPVNWQTGLQAGQASPPRPPRLPSVTGAPLASGLNKRSSFLPTLEAGPTAAVEADHASGPYLAASPYAHVVGPWARLCPDPLSLGHRSGGIGATLVISFDLNPRFRGPVSKKVTSKNISTRSDKALNFGISEQQCNEKIAQIHGVWRNPTCIHLGQGWLVCHRVWGLLTLTRAHVCLHSGVTRVPAGSPVLKASGTVTWFPLAERKGSLFALGVFLRAVLPGRTVSNSVPDGLSTVSAVCTTDSSSDPGPALLSKPVSG